MKIIKIAKWGKNNVVKQPGKYDGVNLKELRKRLRSTKSKQKSYKNKNNGKAKKEYTDLLRELNFAIRAKQRGRGKWNDVKK